VQEEKTAKLQKAAAKTHGLPAAYELLCFLPAASNPNSGYGAERSISDFWDPARVHQHPGYVDTVQYILAETQGLAGLASSVQEFAQHSYQLVGDRHRAAHCRALEEVLKKAQDVSELGLMPALQQISPFAHNLLEQVNVIRDKFGPQRAVQLAALALQFLRVRLTGQGQSGGRWGWVKNLQRYSEDLSLLLQKSAVLGQDSRAFATLADQLLAEVLKYGPKLPEIDAGTGGTSGMTPADLWQAVQLCDQVGVIKSARSKSVQGSSQATGSGKAGASASSGSSAASGNPTTGSSEAAASAGSGEKKMHTPAQERLYAFAAAILDHIVPVLAGVVEWPKKSEKQAAAPPRW
jgi:hypothetical protein